MVGRCCAPPKFLGAAAAWIVVSTIPAANRIVRPTTQPASIMTSSDISRRSFLKNSTALAAGAPFLAGLVEAQSRESSAPLMAYVGTFSSPLRDMLPTQVDLPPG